MNSPRFHKRCYKRPAEFGRDAWFLITHLRDLMDIARGRGIAPAFRERLMLVVTAANRCRYCAHFHGSLAKGAGVSRDEVRQMLEGIVEHCPPQEALALGYAQNWAENDGVADAAIRTQVVQSYPKDLVARIDITLQIIRFGNLVGNTVDAALYRLSGGRIGGDI